jgi:hypothetical protein
MKPHIVSIVFRDITATCDWTTADEVDCLQIEVIGWEVCRDDKTVKLATARDPEGNYSAVHAIPTGCIESTTILLPGRALKQDALSDSEDSAYS